MKKKCQSCGGMKCPGFACVNSALDSLLKKYTEEEQAILKRRLYKRPDSYMGPDYYNTICVAGRSRDSDALEESNFECAFSILGGKETKSVFIVRDHHWAVGWVEALRVDIRNVKRTRQALEIWRNLENYPVLDEFDWSERQWNDMESTFKNNSDFFRSDLEKFLGVDNLDAFTSEQVDEFLWDVMRFSGDYSGLENAWVDSNSINQYLRNSNIWNNAENPILLACLKLSEVTA